MPTFRAFPRHLRPLTGKGMVTCALTGFLRRPEDIVVIDGVPTARDKADFYDNFGYTHPQDVPQPETGGDPRPVDYGGFADPKSKSELGISDQEIEASIREGRPQREGF